MTEPDVALTDFALTIECAVLAWMLLRQPGGDRVMAAAFTVFFAALAVAALAGGLVHGFFLDAAGQAHRLLWPASLLAIGGAAAAGFHAAWRAAFAEAGGRVVPWMAVSAYAAYAAAIVFGPQDFRLAILFYLPVNIFLLLVFGHAAARHRAAAPAWAALGLLLSIGAGAVQQLKIALHPTYLSYNALYHLILAVALVLIYLGARWLIARPPLRVGSTA
ncbi:MAG TPA: hypothetical protein VGA60_13475 [Kiloniellales bacterium]|jgi:hypothetical protein